MIELRWLDKEAWDEAKHEPLGYRVQVLQYRHLEYPYIGAKAMEWSFWQDVPTVREGV